MRVAGHGVLNLAAHNRSTLCIKSDHAQSSSPIALAKTFIVFRRIAKTIRPIAVSYNLAAERVHSLEL